LQYLKSRELKGKIIDKKVKVEEHRMALAHDLNQSDTGGVLKDGFSNAARLSQKTIFRAF